MADDGRQPSQGASPCERCGRRPSGDESHKRGLNTKLHLAVDAHGMPVRALVTEGTTADGSQAVELIEGMDAESLLADKAYDPNAILSYCEEHEVIAVIPPKRSRKHPRA